MPRSSRRPPAAAATDEGETFEAALAPVDEDTTLSSAGALTPAAVQYNFPVLHDKTGNIIPTFDGTNAGKPVPSPGTKPTINPAEDRIMRWQRTQLALGIVTPSEIKGTASTADIAFFFKEEALPGSPDEVVRTLVPTAVCMVCE